MMWLMEGIMQGLMMDMLLLISGFIQYVVDYYGEVEIVVCEIEGDIYCYIYVDVYLCIKCMVLVLKWFGMK